MAAWGVAASVALSPAMAQQAVARMSVTDTSGRGANVKGAVEIKNGQMEMSSGVEVNAGEHATEIQLARGGKVKLCAFSGVHISKGTNASEVMLALDHGAMEVHGTLGEFSDVLMTPDMRLILSGPGTEDLGIRVNGQGDTCVNNAGPHAPYVTVTEQLGSGLYRVQAGQHITFEHGSVEAVVDAEKEPCGCPPEPAVSVASAGTSAGRGETVAKPGAAVGTSSSVKPAFPLAESEGLAPPEKPQTVPVVPPGTVHAEVTIPFRYDGSAPPPASGDAGSAGSNSGTSPSAGGAPAAGMGAMNMDPQPAASVPVKPGTESANAGAGAKAGTATATAPVKPPGSEKQGSEKQGGWHAIGRFFKRLFGV
jgi:hypothetical protein